MRKTQIHCRTALVLLLVWTLLALGYSPLAAQTDVDRMQGTWVCEVTQLGSDNKQKATGDTLVLSIDGNHGSLHLHRPKPKKDKIVECKIRLDPSRSPKHIDMFQLSNRTYFGAKKADVILGVYEFKDKHHLVITYFNGNIGWGRPKGIISTLFTRAFVRKRGTSVLRIATDRIQDTNRVNVTATIHNASDKPTRAAVRVILPSSLSLASPDDTRRITVQPWKKTRVSWAAQVSGELIEDQLIKVEVTPIKE